MAPLGIFAPGLIYGTLGYLVLGIVGSFVASSLAKETPNISKGDSRRLGLVVVWIAVTCMWMFWMFTYMHQMMPLIFPIKQKITAANA